MTRFMGMMVKTSLVREMGITLFMVEVMMTQSPVEREMTLSKAITEMTLLILEKEKMISTVVMGQTPSKLEVEMT